ncbi:MAG: winged helix-turn-helix domain-containing protein [Desulfurococcales archaeon]|nr:winged helix-turn-helix domain-containing protein [Desulfurococcales archaeon]
MDIERLLSSKGRIKILKLLLERGQLNISRIIRETGLHHKLVVKHLNELIDMGLVVERRYGRMRLFEADLTNPKISAIREILRELERL